MENHAAVLVYLKMEELSDAGVMEGVDETPLQGMTHEVGEL
jgi:hypothetical protein